jgi:hypothetical protein
MIQEEEETAMLLHLDETLPHYTNLLPRGHLDLTLDLQVYHPEDLHAIHHLRATLGHTNLLLGVLGIKNRRRYIQELTTHPHRQDDRISAYGVHRILEAGMDITIVDNLRIKADHIHLQLHTATLIVTHTIETVIIADPQGRFSIQCD